MYSNIHFDSYNDTIHLWETIKGEKMYTTIDWTPFVFIPVKIDTGIKSIFGDNATKKSFNSYKDYKNFQSDNINIFENNVNPAIQFLTERYHSLTDPVLPKLHIGYLDIETPYDKGFPTVESTPAPVCLIAIVDENHKRTVFGIHDYDNKGAKKVNFIKCDDEKDLLIRLFNWMHEEKFDVITGWNVSADSKMNKHGGFDLPYLIRRSMLVFGKSTNIYKKMSPINKVKIFKSKKIEGVYNVDIAGVTVIDYLSIYKWFTNNNLESFKLDYVAETELGRGKLDYSEYKSLYQMYEMNWNKFVDYCILDSDIVLYLEEKLGYIALAQTLTSYCCVPMKNYNSSVPLIEGLMIKHYRNNNLCAPYLHGGIQEWFPAAYVKEPDRGLHDDVIDLDIASSYPTHIILLNMSLETYIGRIVGFDKQDIRDFKTESGIHLYEHEGRSFYNMIVGECRKGEFKEFHMLKDSGFEEYQGKKLDRFNMAFKRKLISIAPNGAIFMNNPLGVIADVEKRTYDERVKQKNLKKKYKTLAKETEGSESQKYKEMSNNRHTLQWAIKILINSMFGVMAVPYSRYMNVHMAEAITSCGRHTIQMGEVFVDDLLNNPNEDMMNIINEIKEMV